MCGLQTQPRIWPGVSDSGPSYTGVCSAGPNPLAELRESRIRLLCARALNSRRLEQRGEIAASDCLSPPGTWPRVGGSSLGRVALSARSCSVGHSCLCRWVTVLQLQEHPLLKGAISSLFWLLGLLRVNVLELDQFKKNVIDEGLAPLWPKTKLGFGLWSNVTFIMEDFYFSDSIYLYAPQLTHSSVWASLRSQATWK